MLRINRLTDYAVVILTHIAESSEAFSRATDIAKKTGLAKPTVSKLVKQLARKGFLISKQGAQGGSALSQSPDKMSIADIISALEGPIAITACNLGESFCAVSSICATKTPWTFINQRINHALTSITLADLLKNNRKIA